VLELRYLQFRIWHQSIGEAIRLNIFDETQLQDIPGLIVASPGLSVDEAFRVEAMFLFDFL
jgi:hypothetical protein